MKIRNNSKTRKFGLFSMLLALIGLGGCDPIEPVEAMYGSPYALFSVKGAVTDESGNPVQDIEVRLFGVASYDGQEYLIEDYLSPVRTDRKGSYMVETRGEPYQTLQVNVKDIDGPANGGEFASDSVRTSNYQLVKEDDKSNLWYFGKADVTMPDIKLKKK